MAEPALLILDTCLHRYVVPKSDVHALQTMVGPSAYTFDLGALLDQHDLSTRRRRPGLVVPLRRKELVFLVEKIDLLEHAPQPQRLPRLLSLQLAQPWATGVVEVEGQLILQIDLRAVARTAWIGRDHID